MKQRIPTLNQFINESASSDITELEVQKKIGVPVTDNTETYLDPGVEFYVPRGLTLEKVFSIDDEKVNPEGYGFELNIYKNKIGKRVFQFVIDDEKELKCSTNDYDKLDKRVYQEIRKEVEKYFE